MSAAGRQTHLDSNYCVNVCASEQPWVLLPVVVRVSLEGQVRRVVADPSEEDDDGAQGHHRGHQEQTQPVDGASNPTPVVLLLQRETESKREREGGMRMRVRER